VQGLFIHVIACIVILFCRFATV